MTAHQRIVPANSVGRSPSLVNDVLEDYGAATLRVMERYLSAGAEDGPGHALMADYPGRSGKMMRPSICIAHARAFGADIEQAVLTAAAIELMHNALLIHDDIEDGSEVRRGKPALHRLHGLPQALNAGDMLMLLSLRPLMDNATRLGEHLALRILRETEVMARETAEGQAIELAWRDSNVACLTEADYLRMVLKKTAWFSTIHPTRVGVLIGSQGRAEPSVFHNFSYFLGAAFQIQDDLLNLVADARYGKEMNGDLWEGKRTLMLIHAQRNGDISERARLHRILAMPRDRRMPDDVAWMRAMVDRHNGVSYARTVAEALAGAARYEFSRAYDPLPDSRDKQFIAALIPWVFEQT